MTCSCKDRELPKLFGLINYDGNGTKETVTGSNGWPLAKVDP